MVTSSPPSPPSATLPSRCSHPPRLQHPLVYPQARALPAPATATAYIPLPKRRACGPTPPLWHRDNSNLAHQASIDLCRIRRSRFTSNHTDRMTSAQHAIRVILRLYTRVSLPSDHVCAACHISSPAPTSPHPSAESPAPVSASQTVHLA